MLPTTTCVDMHACQATDLCCFILTMIELIQSSFNTAESCSHASLLLGSLSLSAPAGKISRAILQLHNASPAPQCFSSSTMLLNAYCSLTHPLLDCTLYLTQYLCAAGTLPSSANDCILGNVYLGSNSSRTAPRGVSKHDQQTS